MKHKYGIIYYAFAAAASICLTSGLLILSGGEFVGDNG